MGDLVLSSEPQPKSQEDHRTVYDTSNIPNRGGRRKRSYKSVADQPNGESGQPTDANDLEQGHLLCRSVRKALIPCVKTNRRTPSIKR